MVLILIWRFCGFFVEQNNSVKPGNCYLANLLWQKKSSRSWASSLLQWIPNFSYGERWRPRLTFQNDTWVSLRRVTLAARRLQSRSTQCTSLQVGLLVGLVATTGERTGAQVEGSSKRPSEPQSSRRHLLTSTECQTDSLQSIQPPRVLIRWQRM